MGHEAKLFALNTLAGQIDSERIKLTGNPPKPDTHGHNEVERKIEGWQQTIQNVQRDLKSQSHFNHMVHEKQRFGGDSYAAGQRLMSQENNVAQLSDALGKVALALLALEAALRDGPNAETRALDGVKHALNNWLKAAKNSDAGVTGAAPQDVQAMVRQLETQMPGGGATATPGVIDIFTLLLSMIALIKTKYTKK